jgi:Ca-activated chloride channel family protein
LPGLTFYAQTITLSYFDHEFGGIFMKAIGPIKSLVIVSLLFSIFLSACSSAGDQTAGNNSYSKAGDSMPAPYEMAAANSNAAMASKPYGLYEDEKEEVGSGERYAQINENPFLETAHAPLSTFSIDVDTASYSNVRRFIKDGQLPPKDAVRIEEMINYFDYDYPQPLGDVPFSVTTETASCPWNAKHRLAMIGLQGKKVALDNTPPSNLVFLIDVSGSMNEPNKLPLVKQGLKLLVNQIKPNDRVALAVYAGNSGLVLPSTPGSQKHDILSAIDRLEAGGSTNGGQGIQLAYQVAKENFIPSGNNRVILATDGDFNVGLTNDGELVSMIESKRKSGIFLSVLGFGSGNLNDSMMEKLADKGNGNYAYIDSQEEARKALGEQVAGTLYTIAKDVKIQVEFNPAKVAGYRLLGYENRMLAAKDFNDDRKDAGEIGAGHTVTAIYEIVPAGEKVENDGIELKYSQVQPSDTQFSSELLTVKLRYKEPKENESKLLTTGLMDGGQDIANASENLKFAASVAQFGLLLRDSRYKGNASIGSVISLANAANSSDLNGYRGEFVDLVSQAKRLINSRG